MIKARVSLYPVDQEGLDSLTGLPSKFLDEHALDYDFRQSSTSLDTTITGSDDEVWTALRHLFQENCRQAQDIVMVTTLVRYT
ncbi:MAG: hypothetical protein ACOX46_07150 [Limnochordia bacterium]|jgi:hypothetical protein|nr:hypothetical protein [Bacillota bacterium]NLL09200.1 hypothetical protein [Bacillota bacterium]HBG09853.1 hypothetical protein [Bacillota bacterium]